MLAQPQALGDSHRSLLQLLSWDPHTFRTMGLPSFISWASIMATLWSMVVEWSVLSAEFPTKVPRANTAAHRTCKAGDGIKSGIHGWCVCHLHFCRGCLQVNSIQFM